MGEGRGRFEAEDDGEEQWQPADHVLPPGMNI
jgi:hypothetical protein